MQRHAHCAGPLLSLAAILLAIDLFIALFVAGHLPRLRRRAKGAAAVLLVCVLGFGLSSPAEAQTYRYQQMPDGTFRRVSTAPQVVPIARSGNTTQKEIDAALTMRLGYVETTDRALNERTRAGLSGLSSVLSLRTSVEPAEPDPLNLETDALELYPLIYFSVPENAPALSGTAIGHLNTYLRSGGALEGLDAPPLQPTPANHVLARSFYLLDDYPGRFANRRLWIERTGGPNAPRGDGVSRLFIGDADWVSAWAVDERGRDLYSVDGGPQQREMARRFGVNLVMYVLTGNYKDDQVHLPALLERLGDGDAAEDPRLPDRLPEGGPQ